MARIRTVKPELFKHEELFDLEKSSGFPLRLSFIGLFACSDREGRFKWRPRALKLDIAPYDTFDFEDALNVLVTAGIVEKYEVDGECYGWIPTWSKHQTINIREAQSTLPAPIEGVVVRAPVTHVHAHAGTDEGYAHEYRGVNVAPALRETIFARDNHTCARCGAKDDLTVDHIFPQCIGGTHAPANLRTLCRPCNSARPVVGQALLDDLASDGFTLEDMQRMCMHVHAPGEGKGKEGKGKGREKEGKEILVELKPDDDVTKIFAYWQKIMDKPRAQLDDKRKRLIASALKKYEPRAICEAILGCSKSEYHMGVGVGSNGT
jgi:hypothetical protein